MEKLSSFKKSIIILVLELVQGLIQDKIKDMGSNGNFTVWVSIDEALEYLITYLKKQ